MGFFDDYKNQHGTDTTKNIVNVEWVLKKLDELIERFLPLSGGKMAGRIEGANKKGSWISTFTANTAFYVPPNDDPLPGSTAQGVLSWRTAYGDGYAINSVSGSNTARLQYAAKTDIDNNRNISSDVFWIENGRLYVNTPPLP